MAKNEQVRYLIEQYRVRHISKELLKAALLNKNPHPSHLVEYNWFIGSINEMCDELTDGDDAAETFRIIEFFEDDDFETTNYQHI